MAQQTAVEWLVDSINQALEGGDIDFVLRQLKKRSEQAKQMEKEQKIDFAKRYAKRCQAPMVDSKWLEENN